MFTKNIVATKTCGSLFDDLRLVLSFSAYSAVISTNTSILSRKYWLASSIDSGSSLNAITSALQSLLFQTIVLKLNTSNCRLIDNVPLFICSYALEGWFKTHTTKISILKLRLFSCRCLYQFTITWIMLIVSGVKRKAINKNENVIKMWTNSQFTLHNIPSRSGINFK